MNLLLTRTSSGPNGTLGVLTIDGVFEAYTMEPDEDRAEHPAIPTGGPYQVIVNHSTRFGRMLPLIIGVPGRLGVRIHPGNHGNKDSHGCILLGTSQTPDAVLHSRVACEHFQRSIATPLAHAEPVMLTILHAPEVIRT